MSRADALRDLVTPRRSLALRSWTWRHEVDTYRMAFHQGTPTS